jgi:hypothetical protein
MRTHPRDFSPLGWEIRDRVESEQRAPKRSEGIAYLTLDDPYAVVPCSRYGRDSEDCAPVAWRLAYLLAREPITFDDLDYAMGAVVNDHDDVAYIIRTYGHRMYS